MRPVEDALAGQPLVYGENLLDRRADEDVGTREPERELVVPTPTAEEDTIHDQLPCDRVWVLALPLPRRSQRRLPTQVRLHRSSACRRGNRSGRTLTVRTSGRLRVVGRYGSARGRNSA